MDSLTYLVFVYGSLKSGFYNHAEIENETKICEARTSEEFLLYPNFDYLFPYLFKNDNLDKKTTAKKINGEVYEVTKEKLKQLDILEGVDSKLYQREEIEVESKDGATMRVFVYIADSSLLEDSDEVDVLPFSLEEWTLEHEKCGFHVLRYLEGVING